MPVQNRQKFVADGVKIVRVIKVDIYLDVLVILNTYMTWLLLSVTAMICKIYPKPMNRAVASFAGGLSSLIILIPNDVKLLALTASALKILSCAGISYLAFRPRSLKKAAVLSLSFLASNMLTASALWLTESFLNVPKIALGGGFIYLDISPLNLIISTAVIYFAVCLFSKMFSKNVGASGSYRVDFSIGCKVFSLDAFADTGNTAKDLFSGLPVIICTGVDIEPRGHIRAVPYKTVSGEGVLYACRPDSLTLTDGRGNAHEVTALVAGLPEGDCRAVFNPNILT